MEISSLYEVHKNDIDLVKKIPELKQHDITLKTLLIATKDQIKDVCLKLKLSLGLEISFVYLIEEFKGKRSQINSKKDDVAHKNIADKVIIGHTQAKIDKINSQALAQLLQVKYDDEIESVYPIGNKFVVYL